MIYSTFVVFIQNSEAEYYLHPIQMYRTMFPVGSILVTHDAGFSCIRFRCAKF